MAAGFGSSVASVHPITPEGSPGVKPVRWVVRGSRLQQRNRTAISQSGSPPIGGHRLTNQITHRQIDDLIAAAIEHGFKRP